ncbi:uncharacterized protein LTHEOB_11755 [Lasiodiplodia theobromae]|uniref:uncharacterized protein n=1 Tax=Lasiodiplodia theobromae TaxID=45133 RepID=UPI0015C2D77D|nr:uncharacterized protein LTHEOB_11755 [Lasiodiplodia theobromae]KAF4536887.1 hypothetical protein LTHEOB_11755 [Lasiodiplodia theobromae]
MDSMLEKFDRLMGTFEARTSQISQKLHDPAIDALQNELNRMQDLQSQHRTQEEEPESDAEDVESLPDRRDEPAGHLVADAQGKLRYVGGTTNLILIEAVQSLGDQQQTSPLFATPGPSDSRRGTSTSIIGLPFFSGGSSTSLRLPCAVSPEQISFPPQYISDLLVNLYFDHFHYTFPILFKPYFMRGERPGQEFYEKAWLLYYGAAGQGTIEQVQCLALLSVCSAGWNTLTQAWKFAGQAVRSAQDLGLHTGLRRPAQDAPNELLLEQVGRRVWWSVYGLDRLLSMCLGRPMAADDDDCDCELPLDMTDEHLEIYCRDPAGERSTSSALAGFLAFSELCKIASKIVKSTRRLQRSQPSRIQKELQSQTEALNSQLQQWLQNLPDVVKFSANRSDEDGRLHLTMCIITFILHAASIINLQRPRTADKHGLTEPPKAARNHDADGMSSAEQCIQAARSCIHTAELILFRVPPSHYLAFSIHELAVAGVLLLRTSPTIPPPVSVQEDVQRCIRHLGDLQRVWAGAERSKAILQDLLQRATEAAESSFELFGGAAEQREILDPDFFVNFEAVHSLQL